MLRAVLTQGLVEAVGGAVTFVGALIAMLIIDPVLLGLTVLVVAIAITTVTLLSRRVREASHAAQEKVGDVAASVERAISAVRTIRAVGRDRARDPRPSRPRPRAPGRMGVKVAKISALIVPVAGIAMQVSFLVVLGVGGFRVASGAITVSDLVAFILFLFMMILPLGQAFGAITSVNLALGALGRIQEILDLPDEDAHDRELAPLALMVGDANEGVLPDAPAIEFDDVHFAYATTRSDPADPDNESPDEHLPEPVGHRPPAGAARRLVPRCRAGSASRSSAPRAPASRRCSPSSSASTTRSVGVVRMGGLDLRSIDRARAACADRLRRAGCPGAGRLAARQPQARQRPTRPTPSASTCCAR